MSGRTGNSGINKRFGIGTIVLTAVLFLFAGFFISARTNMIGSAAADNPPAQTQASIRPFVESPFTPLVEKLTPSVVNVKVSKLEKAEFPFQQMPGQSIRTIFQQPPVATGQARSGRRIGSDHIFRRIYSHQ